MTTETTRDRIIQTTSNLLEMQGYYATGLNQIVKESQTPKGSLYHYFPDGKEELAAEAVLHRGEMVAERMRESLAAYDDPAEGVRQHILQMADHISRAEGRAGAPIAMVALETSATNERIREACEQVYQSWQQTYANKLIESGFSPEKAAVVANIIIASIEGAIVLSRTYRSMEPLRQIADMLADLVQVERSSAEDGQRQ
jgi:TetR/AcrR family transcriptional repressor of lmrAB and yxaGH operons